MDASQAQTSVERLENGSSRKRRLVSPRKITELITRMRTAETGMFVEAKRLMNV